ncbi:leucine rich repeat protein [Aspergillus sp. HF37]|nr:leucine rich repeat protein [Aspergillus sp. HF37]
MGKLHYQARKIEGVKAGQVVSKDLKKRITPGPSAKAAARDPTLELDVSSKRLTDEGFDQFIDDLIECIKFHDKEHPEGAARLTDFILQGNELSAKSLLKLAEVVALSAGDLRELDISQNNIQVQSPQDKGAWQAFLVSFRHCYMLKKLDLGNNRLGIAGIEILARVYIQSDLDFVEGDVEAILGAEQEDGEPNLVEYTESMSIKPGKENEPMKSRPKKPANRSKGSKPNGERRSMSAQVTGKTVSQADLKRYACTRGLRSIPYLILSNSYKTNVEIIHLASMLSMQQPPEQLLAFLPPGKALALPNTVDECKGIIWLPNNELDAVARRMVDIGEAVRQLSASDSDGEESYENRRTSDGTKPSAESPSSARDTTGQRKLQKKLDIEYMRLAKRIRMDALKNNNVHAVEIWSTALKMMVVSRTLLLEDRHRIVKTPSEVSPLEDEPVEAVIEQEEHDPEDGFPEEQESEVVPTTEHAVSSFDPASEAFDIEFPALHVPKRAEVAIHDEVEANNPTTESPTPEAQMPATRQGRGNGRAHFSPGATQKEITRGGLSLDMWRRIIADAVGAEGILSQNQQVQIMRYASDWDVLAYKLTIQGVEDYQQIWKFLETVGCFIYSPHS